MIITVNTLFGPVDFYIMKSDIPFLMSLKHMDCLSIYFNNIINQLVGKNGVAIYVDRKWGHFWLYLRNVLMLFFTEAELRYIYTKFGYLSVIKLYDLLNKAGYNVKTNVFKDINKFCYYCQIKG